MEASGASDVGSIPTGDKRNVEGDCLSQEFRDRVGRLGLKSIFVNSPAEHRCQALRHSCLDAAQLARKCPSGIEFFDAPPALQGEINRALTGLGLEEEYRTAVIGRTTVEGKTPFRLFYALRGSGR